jgi:predicted transcriptional regulator
VLESIQKVTPMSKTSTLELPIELKERIERVAKERKEEPATLLAFAIDSLLTAHEAQLAEIRRRDLISNSGKGYTHEEAMAKLDSLRPSRRTSESK